MSRDAGLDALQAYGLPHLGSVFGRLVSKVRNWYTVGLLAAIVVPTRIPPRRGLGGTWLGTRPVTFLLRDGARVKCRLQDAGDLISVYLDQDYARQGVDWRELRTIVDVGATVGCFEIWASRLAPEARFVAVEPNPEVYPYLLANMAANGLASRVTAVQTALAGASGEGQMADNNAATVGTVVAAGSGTGRLVTVTGLEELFDDLRIEHCDLLKIDCEGGEYDILLNSPDAVVRRAALILCEYHPHPVFKGADLVRRLTGLGYAVEEDAAIVGFLRARLT
jgi:FkbM family methyltransferase